MLGTFLETRDFFCRREHVALAWQGLICYTSTSNFLPVCSRLDETNAFLCSSSSSYYYIHSTLLQLTTLFSPCFFALVHISALSWMLFCAPLFVRKPGIKDIKITFIFLWNLHLPSPATPIMRYEDQAWGYQLFLSTIVAFPESSSKVNCIALVAFRGIVFYCKPNWGLGHPQDGQWW